MKARVGHSAMAEACKKIRCSEEKNMTIEITMKEYFEQLQLMEQQYGQEEDLYPWIYMLLQMAECRKKADDPGYKGVSIRDVHNAKGRGISIKDRYTRAIRKYIKKDAVPDFIILDKECNAKVVKDYGCVEIKVLNHNYLTMEENKILQTQLTDLEPEYKLFYGEKQNEYIIVCRELYNKILKYKFTKNNIIYDCLVEKSLKYTIFDCNQDIANKSTVNSNYKKKVKKENGEVEYRVWFKPNEKWGYINVTEDEYNKLPEYDFWIKITGENIEICYEDIISDEEQDERLEKIAKQDKNYKYEKKTSIKANSVFKDGDIANEIVCHLINHKKVLYTNGLQFCTLCLKEKENQQSVQIEEIANLKDLYVSYKSNNNQQEENESNENENEGDNNEEDTSWKMLIDKLQIFLANSTNNGSGTENSGVPITID